LELRQSDGYFGPEVRILIDGHDLFNVGDQAGHDPAQPLDTGALRPVEPPRRIALYMCNCGCAGCGDIAPIIRQIGDRIEWVQLRLYTGAFDWVFPDEDFGPEDDDGKALELPDLSFDVDRHFAEVWRAKHDRAWESPARRLARAAADAFRNRSGDLAPRGYSPRAISTTTDAHAFHVDLRSKHGQRVVLVRTTGDPRQKGDGILETIVDRDEESWIIAFANYGPLAAGPGRRS